LLALLLTASGCLGSANAQMAGPPTQSELETAIREGAKTARPATNQSGLPTPKEKKAPLVIDADNLDGVSQKQLTARGNVVLQQADTTLAADTIKYDQPTDTATAEGHVRLDRAGDIVTGKTMSLKLQKETGQVTDPTFLFGKSPSRPKMRFEAHGTATLLEFEGPQQERLFNATYSTCKPGGNEWTLKIRELALDRNTNVGTGYGGIVDFKGMPILYLPYMTFPLNSERKSGFLPPTFGSSSNSGAEIAVPYYWNISPDTDATITPKLFSKRGVQLGSELRYLRPHAIGQLEAELLPNDRRADRSRQFFSWRHYQVLEPLFGKGWSGSINAQKVSDDAYFRDLSTRIANTTQTTLPREAAISYASDFGNFALRTLNFQTLQDPLTPIGSPYKLLPQLSFNARPARIRGFELNTFGEYSDFRHPTLVNGQRLLIYPSASYSLRRPFGFITPKLGYHMTHYDLTKNETGFEGGSRALPIFSIDSGLAFERLLDWGGGQNGSITQTLEPRLFYLNVPYRDQSKLPQFSTAETDFNFAQMFNENLFVGGDRISDAKQLTAAVTTRFIDNETGIERLRAAVGQRYYFRPQQVALSSTALGVTPANGVSTTTSFNGTASKSDLLFTVGGQLSKSWTLDSSFQYSTTGSRFQKSNVAANYAGEGGRLINFSYRFIRNDIKQIDVSTQLPLGTPARGWTLLARANHSIKDKRLLEGLLGAEYNQGCWEIRMLAHRFATATNRYSNSFQLQLELKGLSKLGVNTFETIRQNIAGYRRSDDR
jgi:LPS-assembly protein